MKIFGLFKPKIRIIYHNLFRQVSISELPLTMEDVVKQYSELAKIPSISSARFVNGGVEVIQKQRNLIAEKFTTSLYIQGIDSELRPTFKTFPLDISNEILVKLSPSGNKRAVLKTAKKQQKDRQFLEIWSNNQCEAIDLDEFDLHGKIYTSGEFTSLAWSFDESKIAYIAEKKEEKSEPFIKQRKPNSSEEVKKTIGEEYDYRQGWGEKMVGKVQSVICIYHVSTNKLEVVVDVPQDYAFGQLVWSPITDYLVGAAWKTSPRKLGLYACTNRPGNLFECKKLNDQYKVALLMPENDISVSSPRFNPKGTLLVWFQRSANGPHNACLSLRGAEITSDSKLLDPPKTLIDIVETHIKTSDGGLFTGIYTFSPLIERCFLGDSRIIFSTVTINQLITYVFDLERKTITAIENNNESNEVMDVQNDKVLIKASSFNKSEYLYIVDANDLHSKFTVTEPLLKTDNYEVDYVTFKHDSDDDVTEFNGIYYGPKPQNVEKQSVPLIFLPHGGPHCVLDGSYNLTVSLYRQLGWAMLLLNYRGSSNQGEKSLRFLSSRVGRADVDDCVLATKNTLNQRPELDPKRVVAVGGSHGGFLSAHLIGQFPKLYCTTVIRNPVIDMASMSITSDIPDWCAYEVGESFTQKGPISEELMIKQRRMSPICHVHKVEVPVLLQLGSEDLRVPHSQGLEYFHRLKANGVKVRMQIYEDNHSLLKIPVEIDSKINGIKWILDVFSNAN